MALEIMAGGFVIVALVLAIRCKRDDIPSLAEALSRWFGPRR